MIEMEIYMQKYFSVFSFYYTQIKKIKIREQFKNYTHVLTSKYMFMYLQGNV